MQSDDILIPDDEELCKDLVRFPVEIITGIVSADGPSGGRGDNNNRWSWQVSFDAWRAGDGPLETIPLTVRKIVSYRKLNVLQNTFDPETLVKIRARLSRNNSTGSPQARFVKFLEHDPVDAELSAYLVELQKPITVEDKVFGTLTFNRRAHWYEAPAVWNGQSITLHLSADSPEDRDRSLETAHLLWRESRVWEKRVQEYAVRELLQVKNDSWREEGEEEISAEEFTDSLVIESITVRPDGSFEFWHQDEEMFWGHVIYVGGNLSGEFDRADIVG